MTDRKIEHVRIVPTELLPGLPGADEIRVTFEGEDSEVLLTSFFPDEIAFSPSEFVGLTEREAMRLITDRDITYLRSD